MEPEGGEIAAFFDVDHTVLSVSSGRQWVRYLRRSGRMTGGALVDVPMAGVAVLSGVAGVPPGQRPPHGDDRRRR
jgi:hypothetical protein